MASIELVVNNEIVGKVDLDNDRILIGRSSKASIRVADGTVSARHAVVESKINDETGSTEYYIQDLNSTNGTFVRGKRIRRLQLSDGDVFKVGWNTFKFHG